MARVVQAASQSGLSRTAASQHANASSILSFDAEDVAKIVVASTQIGRKL